jgi:ABC-2 type transport system permease protein
MKNNSLPPFAMRRFGRVNWLGLWTLYLREVSRFMKVFTQTIAGPVVTTLLFLLIFKFALGPHRPNINGVSFVTFLAPGLIMMTVIQNAFANTTSSMMMAKMQGNIVDILMPPLSPGEINTGFVLGGLTRGLLVALASWAAMLAIVPMEIAHPWAIIFFGVMGSLLMSLVGLLTGIWAEKFDHMQAITQFVVTPLSFLSGTFYSVHQLPDVMLWVSTYNPLFYLIDGFRYGFTGHAEGDLTVGIFLTLSLAVTLWTACHVVLARGYKLKS